VFSRGGRTYLAEESGVRSLALGEALRSNGTSVVVLACDDQAICAPEIVDVATGRRRRLAPVPDPYDGLGMSVLISEDSERLAVLGYGTGQLLTLYDAGGRVVGPTEVLAAETEPRWLPNDLGLVVPAAGEGVLWISLGPDGLSVERIGALSGVSGEFVFVIPA
jgi:hypothetical protein